MPIQAESASHEHLRRTPDDVGDAGLQVANPVVSSGDPPPAQAGPQIEAFEEGATLQVDTAPSPSGDFSSAQADPQIKGFETVGSLTMRTPLSVAAETEGGEGEVIKAMIARGVDVNEVDEAHPPAFSCIWRQNRNNLNPRCGGGQYQCEGSGERGNAPSRCCPTWPLGGY